MAGSTAQGSTRTSPHHDQQGGFAFLETGPLRRGGSCAKTQVGADAGAELGPPFVHVWGGVSARRGGNERVGARPRGDGENFLGKPVKSSPVQLAAHVRHCRAKPCRKIDGKEGWTRIVFCLDPLEPALEAALLLQKRIRKQGLASRGPLEREASKLLAQMREK